MALISGVCGITSNSDYAVLEGRRAGPIFLPIYIHKSADINNYSCKNLTGSSLPKLTPTLKSPPRKPESTPKVLLLTSWHDGRSSRSKHNLGGFASPRPIDCDNAYIYSSAADLLCGIMIPGLIYPNFETFGSEDDGDGLSLFRFGGLRRVNERLRHNPPSLQLQVFCSGFLGAATGPTLHGRFDWRTRVRGGGGSACRTANEQLGREGTEEKRCTAAPMLYMCRSLHLHRAPGHGLMLGLGPIKSPLLFHALRSSYLHRPKRKPHDRFVMLVRSGGYKTENARTRVGFAFWLGFFAPSSPSSAKMPSHKTFIIKKKLAKKMRQNRPIPHWIRMRTDNTISRLYPSRLSRVPPFPTLASPPLPDSPGSPPPDSPESPPSRLSRVPPSRLSRVPLPDSPRSPLPTLPGPPPDSPGPLPTLRVPLPTLGGPPSRLSGPLPTLRVPPPPLGGPLPTLPVPSPSQGPLRLSRVPPLSGPPSLSGPPPDSPGSPPPLSGSPLPTLGSPPDSPRSPPSPSRGPPQTLPGPPPRLSRVPSRLSGSPPPTLPGPPPRLSRGPPLPTLPGSPPPRLSGSPPPDSPGSPPSDSLRSPPDSQGPPPRLSGSPPSPRVPLRLSPKRSPEGSPGVPLPTLPGPPPSRLSPPPPTLPVPPPTLPPPPTLLSPPPHSPPPPPPPHLQHL
ncbi:hypothetical protein H6P81_000758 [Aristolochia fimbriata]|uniref:Ribosomal protein L39 n=1 Tax=Aristolochia fimbriata TaxID=158543 RepID=A0AAV7F7M3_ARIFI|nr:hypothetical protein H6P81_000758 [Aristolochia fimbriata]